jgi:hypothetical protein
MTASSSGYASLKWATACWSSSIRNGEQLPHRENATGVLRGDTDDAAWRRVCFIAHGWKVARATDAHKPETGKIETDLPVEFDLVQPVVSGGHILGRHGAAALDEAERRGSLGCSLTGSCATPGPSTRDADHRNWGFGPARRRIDHSNSPPPLPVHLAPRPASRISFDRQIPRGPWQERGLRPRQTLLPVIRHRIYFEPHRVIRADLGTFGKSSRCSLSGRGKV